MGITFAAFYRVSQVISPLDDPIGIQSPDMEVIDMKKILGLERRL